jgi:hypothetical protein
MYICVAESREEFNYFGQSLGMSERRALYYSTKIGRRRVYRSSYPEPKDASFRLFEYKTKSRAQALCEEINSAYGDNFEVIEV